MSALSPLSFLDFGARRVVERQLPAAARQKQHGSRQHILPAGVDCSQCMAADAGRTATSAAFLLGGVLTIWFIGFAQSLGASYPNAVHNFSHDMRHIFAFPCH